MAGTFVVNDIHGDVGLMVEALNKINDIPKSNRNIIILNGDICGSRGPVTNRITSVYYDFKRGDATKNDLENILLRELERKIPLSEKTINSFSSSGTFLSFLNNKCRSFKYIIEEEQRANLVLLEEFVLSLKRKGFSDVYYLPGNGEISILDYDPSEIKKDRIVPLERRAFNRLNRDGFFERIGVSYITEPTVIEEETLLIPIDAVDKFIETNRVKVVGKTNRVNKIVSHYPSYISKDLRKFMALLKYKENELSLLRIDALFEMLEILKIKADKTIFGHIHLAIEKSDSLPKSIEFTNGIWNRPGNILTI